MNKVLLASLVMATTLFAQAAPVATAAQPALDTTKTAPVAQADSAKALEAEAANATADSVKAETIAQADSAKSPEAEAVNATADSVKAETVAQADSAKAPEAEAVNATADSVKAETVAQADSAKSPEAEAVNATTDSVKAETVAKADTAKAVKRAQPAPDMSMAAADSEPKKKKKKREPLLKAGQFEFDINASFEIQAGKTLWVSEDDKNSDNLEEWWGRANLGLETRSNDFNGRILIYMYPGDLQDNQYHTHHTANGDTSDTYEYRDLFEIHEAYAEQHTRYAAIKLGRWEFTQKNGDYFGNYVDGYYNGFKSGTNSENALQFSFTPTETMSMDVAFISTTPNLNTGDLRLMFRFHDLSGIEFLNLDLGYRTNVFDIVHDDDTDVQHTISLQGKTPIVNDLAYFFLEGALMGIDAEETYKDRFGKKRTRTKDLVAPITGGILFTPRDYRIILEAEYIHDRAETDYADKDKKHVKDVLAAFYIEKPLTKRFTLSFGAHSYGTSRDYGFTGNLIGTIH